ncbi:hypothetical protein [Glaciimonas sp. PAMC28666]|uniref:hypothetical protein n=1 Tax=Glaciimonas sp. PAMC28666 TaxID=2807626 RepID=UPI001964271D|nr:hypothetical protein [Glaciimonas sp. PAMC28666]QRX81352.1 hypothetical protein JQN73_14330 [Glaciimonas sp. PAMC28666]
MPESKQPSKPSAIPTREQTDSPRKPSAHRQSTFGHALDGSQQLDILEEQVYANAEAPGKDQPMVPPDRDAIKK